jgi:preprotein translocase subunit SecA
MESSYSRTYKELIDLQTHRAIRNLDAERPPLADPIKIDRFVKQSQANRWREVDIKWKSEDVEIKQLTKAQFEHDLGEAGQRLVSQTQPAPDAKVETLVRDTPKIGRNESCPCGSGQKYKRCCGNPLTQSQIQSATSQASVATATLASPSAA